MSCKVLQLAGCELKGTVFNGRTFLFENRDISNDNFYIKVRLRNSNLINVDGVISENKVFFPFVAMESFPSDQYIIEYWANFQDIGLEMIAIEHFNISLAPCSDCHNENESSFTLEFPEEKIDYTVSYSVININNYSGGMTDAEVKAAYERNPDTNAFTDSEKTKLAGLQNYNDESIKESLQNKVDKLPGKELSSNDFTDEEKEKLTKLEVKNYREIIGYAYQSGNTEDPVLTIQFNDMDTSPILFTRVGQGEYVLQLAEPVDLNKVHFLNAVSYFEDLHPAFTFTEMFLIFIKTESTPTQLKFVSYPSCFVATYPTVRYDGINNAPFHLKIFN